MTTAIAKLELLDAPALLDWLHDAGWHVHVNRGRGETLWDCSVSKFGAVDNISFGHKDEMLRVAALGCVRKVVALSALNDQRIDAVP